MLNLEHIAEKIERKANQKKDYPKDFCFKSYEELTKFAETHDKCKYMKGSKVLELHNFTAEDDLMIFQKLSLAHIEKIIFENCDLSNPHFTKLFKKMGMFPEVSDWTFAHCTLDKQIIDIFLKSKFTKNAEKITVEHKKDQEENLVYILSLPSIQTVTSVSLRGGKVSNPVLNALFESEILPNLVHLDLSNNFLKGRIQPVVEEGEGEEVPMIPEIELETTFFKDMVTPKLRCLSLRKSHISDRMVEQICSNKSLRELKSLDLSSNFNIEKKLINIPNSKILKNLEELHLRNVELTYDTLLELISSPNFSNMKKLDVGLNYSLKDEIPVILLDEPFIRYLTHLNFEKCDLTNESLKVLSENRHLGNLEVLDISNNPNLTVKSIFDEIEDLSLFSKLKKIYCFGNGLSNEEIAKLNKEYHIKLINETEHHFLLHNIDDYF